MARMIKLLDALRVVEQHRGDAVVVAATQAGRNWPLVSRCEELDLPLFGCMGKASSIALGVALATPNRKVVVIDGDGSLLMNLGSLVTIGNKAPPNLYHLVLENGVYATTGGQPIPGEGRFSFQGLAREAGYADAYQFDDLEEFASSFGRILQQRGPVLVCLRIEPEIETRPIRLRPRPRRRTPEALPVLKKALAEGAGP
jgi:phosphonopyruvate decarboxylase